MKAMPAQTAKKLLDLTGRKLKCIPEDIFLQKELEEIWLDDNQLDTLRSLYQK